MKTSVVIATYNGSRFIQEQLDSIINQTVLPDEIVISDDGSTDSTIDIIKSFFRQHSNLPIHCLLVVNKPAHHGVLGNFQNAVNHSSGDYVFFCDQDDIWLPNKIERLVEVLDSCEEKVVIHDAQVLKESENGVFNLIDKHLMGDFSFNSNGLCKINGPALIWQSFYYCVIQGMCVSVKRDYLLSVSPFSKGSNHDNWTLFCATADDTIMAIRDSLAYYRIHKGNTAGISEFKKKRPLWERVKTFDYKGKESILKQYLWYKDASAYLGNREILDDKVRLLISFFADKRIKAVTKNKLAAVIDLVKAYKEGAYEIDRSIVFFHDIAFVMMHSQKARNDYIRTFKQNLRSITG